jgi:uncharacterized membrane protein
MNDNTPPRTTLYDRISLICLIIGGVLLIAGIFFALQASWLKVAIFGISGLIVWRMSTLFARYAIAASGRQK